MGGILAEESQRFGNIGRKTVGVFVRHIDTDIDNITYHEKHLFPSSTCLLCQEDSAESCWVILQLMAGNTFTTAISYQQYNISLTSLILNLNFQINLKQFRIVHWRKDITTVVNERLHWRELWSDEKTFDQWRSKIQKLHTRVDAGCGLDAGRGWGGGDGRAVELKRTDVQFNGRSDIGVITAIETTDYNSGTSLQATLLHSISKHDIPFLIFKHVNARLPNRPVNWLLTWDQVLMQIDQQ